MSRSIEEDGALQAATQQDVEHEGRRARGSGYRRLLAATGAILAGLLLACAPACALETRVFSTSFGSPGSGAGQLSLRPAAEGAAGSGIALSAATHDVYVADTGNARIDEFEGDGAFVRAWGWGVGDGFSAAFQSCSVTCFKGLAGSHPGQFTDPAFVAVDDSAGPSAGDVYVADTADKVVSKFTPTGALLESWGVDGQLDGSTTTSKSFGTIAGIAVDGSGVLEVLDTESTVFRFAQDGSFIEQLEVMRFSEPHGLAVDAEGNLFKANGDTSIEEITSSNSDLGQITQEGGASGFALDPTTASLYVAHGKTIAQYAFAGAGVVKEGGVTCTGAAFAGCPATEVFEAHRAADAGVAVDPTTHAILAADTVDQQIDIYNGPVILPDVSTGEAHPNAGLVALTGTVDPDGVSVTACEFQYVSKADYEPTAAEPYAKGASVPCESNPGAAGAAVKVAADVRLEPDTFYHFRLVAANGNGANQGTDREFLHGSLIEEVEVAKVSATEATLDAAIDPGGQPSVYKVEDGTSPAYGASSPEADIAAADTPAPVSVRLSELQPSTTYHFRFTVTNAYGETLGSDVTFATASPSGASAATLPDDRAFELVSSFDNPGEVYVPMSEQNSSSGSLIYVQYPFRAAANGDGFAYPGDPGPVGGSGAAGGGDNEYLATRSATAGWEAQDITPGVISAEGNTLGSSYEWFSENLGTGIVNTGAAPSFAAEAEPQGPPNCYGIYTRTGSGYHALFKEEASPGKCGLTVSDGVNNNYKAQSMLFAGASADGSQLLLQTPAPLLPEDRAASEPGEGNNLYDSEGGRVTAVSILPDGEHTADATFGGTSGEAIKESGENPYAGDFSNAISADGSRVFWSQLEPTPEEDRPAAEQPAALYAREDPLSLDARTIELDAAEAPLGAGTKERAEREARSGHARFWTANRAGTIVFFTDCTRLTEDSTAVATHGCAHSPPIESPWQQEVFTGNDLYEYDFGKPPGERLTDLTVDGRGESLGADVQGVLGASEDGSYVYFVADGVLAPGAERRVCREAEEERIEGGAGLTAQQEQQLKSEQAAEEEGQLPPGRGCNLYVAHLGTTDFVAALGASDDRLKHGFSSDETMGDWFPDQGYRTAEVPPGGSTLVFESTQQLTGYDNTALDRQSVLPDHLGLEVFVYSPGAGDGGDLHCVSCAPNGAPPSPDAEGGHLTMSLNPTYTTRSVSDDGKRVFFDSSQPLVPQDQNHAQDVYEWEAPASAEEPTNTCAAGSASYSARAGGCVFLISGGNGESSSFLDADVDGDNVFFAHRGALGELGNNGKNNVFDGRVDGGFVHSSHACTGSGCQGVPPAPPQFATPASVTFTGNGNFVPGAPTKPSATQIRAAHLAQALKACRRKASRRKRATCEAVARKRYGPPHKANKRAKTTKGHARTKQASHARRTYR